MRTSMNPLRITHLIVEEASMVGLDLWANLYDAMAPHTQIIFLGDINQIPPVFGKSIMSYALCRLPVIELTHVYRQALETVNKVVATEIMVTTPAADTTFPELPLDEWMVSEYTPRLFDEHNRYSHAFVTYLRRNPIQE